MVVNITTHIIFSVAVTKYFHVKCEHLTINMPLMFVEIAGQKSGATEIQKKMIVGLGSNAVFQYKNTSIMQKRAILRAFPKSSKWLD